MSQPMVSDTAYRDTAFRSEERFTQQEFFAWLQQRPASDVNHYELIRGRIVMSPPAGWPHGALEMRIGSCFLQLCERHDLGIVQGSSAGYDLPSGDTLEPDVSFLSRARFAAGPAPERGRFVGIVPNVAVEILSRSTARRDRTEKKEIYEQCGVDEYWLVDPDHREVTLFVLDGGPLRRRRTDRCRADPVARTARARADDRGSVRDLTIARAPCTCRATSARSASTSSPSLIEAHPFATLVSLGDDGLVATHLPLLWDPAAGTVRDAPRTRRAAQPTGERDASGQRRAGDLPRPRRLRLAVLVSVEARARQGRADLELRRRARLRTAHPDRRRGLAARLRHASHRSRRARLRRAMAGHATHPSPSSRRC